MGQWGREAIDNGTMDVGTLETWTMGPWDNENGTVGHWRITYWALGQCASGAMGREGHGRRDNAQQDNAMDHLPSMHECLSVLLPQLNWPRGPMEKAHGLRSRGLQARVLPGSFLHEYAATWLDFHDPSVVSWQDFGFGKTCRA